MMDIRAHNRIAWDTLADRGDPWTVPVSPQAIEEARQGRWTIVLTPIKPVPREWLDIAGQHVLCLAERHGLAISTVLGDMANLHMFADDSFDLVFHPVSNLFVPDVLPVWREAFRVLRRGGCLLAGFINPAVFIFDQDVVDRTGRFEVKHSLPYSDTARPADEPLAFSHTLEAQIGGQIAAGFSIIGMYEDVDRAGDNNQLSKYMPTFIATRALKSSTP